MKSERNLLTLHELRPTILKRCFEKPISCKPIVLCYSALFCFIYSSKTFYWTVTVESRQTVNKYNIIQARIRIQMYLRNCIVPTESYSLDWMGSFKSDPNYSIGSEKWTLSWMYIAQIP